MRALIIFLLVNIAIAAILFQPELVEKIIITYTPEIKNTQINEQAENEYQNEDAITIVADNLTVPWDFAFIPEGILITERGGTLILVSEEGKETVTTLPTHAQGEGGLLGITLHPEFETNKYLYLYTTQNSENGTINRVDRYRYSNKTITERTSILENIPGAQYHDGGRIEFGPDKKLYITTGDAQTPTLARDKQSLAGKILRVNDDGTLPEDNPFPNSPVYSYGHRNPQGIAWDSEGRLWSTEHGRSGYVSGFDEINLISPGKDYGWPESQGDIVKPRTVPPVYHSGETTTWAPASAVIKGETLIFGGLRGESLYEATIESRGGETLITGLQQRYKGQFGRIRTVREGPTGDLYFTTSNKDGRGIPRIKDDKLIKIQE